MGVASGAVREMYRLQLALYFSVFFAVAVELQYADKLVLLWKAVIFVAAVFHGRVGHFWAEGSGAAEARWQAKALADEHFKVSE